MLSPISSMKIEWATLSIKGTGFSYSKICRSSAQERGTLLGFPLRIVGLGNGRFPFFERLSKIRIIWEINKAKICFMGFGRLRAGCVHTAFRCTGIGCARHSRNGNRRVSAWLTVRRRRVRMESASVCWDSGCDYRTICGR